MSYDIINHTDEDASVPCRQCYDHEGSGICSNCEDDGEGCVECGGSGRCIYCKGTGIEQD